MRDKDVKMQIENGERTVEKYIKKSAEPLKTPDKLCPENLEILLEEKQKERKMQKYRPHRWVYSSLAAAAVLVLAAGVTWRYHMIHTVNDYAGIRTSGSALWETDTETEGSETEGIQTEETSQKIDTLYKSTEQYDEIYEILEKARKDRKSREKYSTAEASSSDESSEGTAADAGAVLESADTGAVEYSETNVRTQGVDEGDIVKTDGAYIYTLSGNGVLHITETKELKEAASAALDNPNDSAREMYLDGDRLYIVASRGEASIDRVIEEDTVSVSNQDFTVVYVYNIENRKKPVKERTIKQSGAYETSRCADGYLYLFSMYYPDQEAGIQKEEPGSFIPANDSGVFKPEDLLIPKEDAGENFITVSAVELKSGKTVSQKAVLTQYGQYYVSQNHIYIYEELYRKTDWGTNILSLSFKKGKIEAKAAGYLQGYIRDSFCIDEYGKYLRVVCQNNNAAALYVLDMDMRTMGKITDIAPGEELKSARFLGNTGYFVTYKEVDPLFCVDLKNPQNPRVLGELKVSGYSRYLHFFGENRLLGIGWETNADTGEILGLKLSMFDISDQKEMKEIHKIVAENGTYAPLEQYKAILADAEKGLIGIGTSWYNEKKQKEEAQYLVFSYDEDQGFGIQMAQNLEAWEEGYSYYSVLDKIRGIFIEDTFYLCGSKGIWAYDMKKEFEETGSCKW